MVNAVSRNRCVLLTAVALLLSLGRGLAQTPTKRLHIGLKGGLALANGYSRLPLPAGLVPGWQGGTVSSQSNGVGAGYVVGGLARLNTSPNGFVQVEVLWNRTGLKQRIDLPLTVNDALANAVGISPALLANVGGVTVGVSSDPTLEAINVPVLLGRRVLGGRVRLYAGPGLVFYRASESLRQVEGDVQLVGRGGGGLTLPVSEAIIQSLGLRESLRFPLKPVSWNLEGGVGLSPLPFLDLDLRYAVPAGGIYQDKAIKGYLGIATLTAALTW